MRRDAARNRERLIETARTQFRAGAADISLEEIASRAGVGRSTLFRHFADRLDLIRAVQAVEMEAILAEKAALGSGPDVLFPLMRTVARLTALYRAMDDALLKSPVGTAMMIEATSRTAEIFVGPVEDARAAGLLHRETTVENILVACSMIGGAIAAAPMTRDAVTMDQAFALILRGIGPPGPK